MTINRQIWDKADINNIPCPHCNKSLEYKELMIKETERGEYMQDCNCGQNEYIFTGELSCTCGNHFFVYGDKDTQECQEGTVEKHQIKGIYPTLNLFKLPNSCPQSVKEELIKSFALYWIDLKACANKIRIAIEVLLDEQNIPKANILNSRLKEYPDETIKSDLFAIKLIGNTGSHADILTKDDILDAYEIMHKVLDELFEKSEEKLQRKVDMINETKKPISKSTK